MPIIVLSSICVVVALLLSAINLVTAPIIKAAADKIANETLTVVLPDGESFEEIDISSAGLSQNVTKAHKETTGKGYVFEIKSSGYKSGMVIMVGIDSEGKITGTKCIATQDTFGKEPEIDGKYNGQTLSDFAPVMIGGATMTSNGYRDAVNLALQSYVSVTGGKLDDSIVLEGMIPTLAPGFVSTVKIEASGNIVKAFKAKNDTGFAYIFKNGDTSVLALVNATGACKIYDAEGNDVTAANEAFVTEAVAHASANQKSYKDAAQTKFGRMVEGATDMTALELNTFGTVAYAASFKVGDTTYYGFYSRSIGFEQMDVYVVLDANGAIAKVDAKAIFFETEYFPVDDNVNEKEYKDSFTGLTPDSFTGDNAMIAGATMTSNAMKQSVNDAFDAFKNLDK
jgi:electron transport complex protein RnfG